MIYNKKSYATKIGWACFAVTMLITGCAKNPADAYKNKLAEIFANYAGDFCIVMDKKQCRLYVFDREQKLAASYPAGYGMNPDGRHKLYSGDNRTPEGVYYINEILSMDAAQDTNAYKKLKAMNSVFFRKKDGHYKYENADEDLGDNVYGPRFYGIDYPNEYDRKAYQDNVSAGIIPKINGNFPGAGGGIAIHGNNDPASIGHKASSGCIRLYNKDVVAIERYVRMGTPVVIVGEN